MKRRGGFPPPSTTRSSSACSARFQGIARRAERPIPNTRCAFRFDTAIARSSSSALNTSPDFAAKVDAWKEDFLDNEAAKKFSASLWQDGKEALAKFAASPDSAAPGAIETALTTFGQKALDDPELLAKLDEFAVDIAVFLVARYQDEVAELIATTVAAWDPDLTSRRVELAIGRDLQFIRINGTIVGGLVGMLIYLISSLFP